METTAFSYSTFKRKPADADPEFLPKTRGKKNSETFDPSPCPAASPQIQSKIFLNPQTDDRVSVNLSQSLVVNLSETSQNSLAKITHQLDTSQKEPIPEKRSIDQQVKDQQTESKEPIETDGKKCEDIEKVSIEPKIEEVPSKEPKEKETPCKDDCASEQFFTPLEGSPESVYTDCSNHPQLDSVKKQEVVAVEPSVSSTSTEKLTDIQSTQEPRSDCSVMTEVLEETKDI